jgi:hypothetical protein
MSRHLLRLGGGVVCHDFVTFFVLFFFYPGSRTAQTDSPIIIVDASNNPVWCKEVLLYKNVRKNVIFGVQSPKNGVIFRRIGIFQLKRKIDRAP